MEYRVIDWTKMKSRAVDGPRFTVVTIFPGHLTAEVMEATVAVNRHASLADSVRAELMQFNQTETAQLDEAGHRERCWLESKSRSQWTFYPDFFRERFVSPFDQYADRIGQRFKVLGHDEKAENDLENWEPLYRIGFGDGTEISAWGLEVCIPVEPFEPPCHSDLAEDVGPRTTAT